MLLNEFLLVSNVLEFPPFAFVSIYLGGQGNMPNPLTPQTAALLNLEVSCYTHERFALQGEYILPVMGQHTCSWLSE